MSHIRRVLGVLVLLSFIATASAQDTITYFHPDATGSPVAATDEHGNLLWREDYAPYGERLRQEVSPRSNRIWFTGHHQDDDSGLIYAGARHYDPLIGRFMSVDPAAIDPANQFSFGRYTYANNNPYTFVDPDGHESAAFYTNSNYQMAQPSPKHLGLFADFTPVVGDIKGVVEAIQNPTVVSVIGAVIGVVPVVGDLGKQALKLGDEAISMGKAIASVDSVRDETDPGAPADGCTLWGENIPDCEHWGRTLAYQTMMEGSPGAPHLNGVRQNIVAKKGVFKDEANVALPCQYLATGALRCAANLPRCEIEQDTVGCKVHVGNAR